ncbi:MAG: hypothetical protein R3A47_05385 [Polyangiales bacterium]
MKKLLVSLMAVAVLGCGDQIAETDAMYGVSFETSDLIDGTPEGVAVLRLLNHADTTYELLDTQAALNARAVAHLIAYRNGPTVCSKVVAATISYSNRSKKSMRCATSGRVRSNF